MLCLAAEKWAEKEWKLEVLNLRFLLRRIILFRSLVSSETKNSPGAYEFVPFFSFHQFPQHPDGFYFLYL